MAEQFLNYIGGDWVPARSGKTFESLNPANREDVVGTFPRSGAKRRWRRPWPPPSAPTRPGA